MDKETIDSLKCERWGNRLATSRTEWVTLIDVKLPVPMTLGIRLKADPNNANVRYRVTWGSAGGKETETQLVAGVRYRFGAHFVVEVGPTVAAGVGEAFAGLPSLADSP